jgi:predicted HicB family RNase H-like nuclease
METVTLTIRLPKDVGSALERRAKTNGKGLTEYVETLITTQAERPNFRDLFADVREGISVGDKELTQEIDAAVAESREVRSKK